MVLLYHFGGVFFNIPNKSLLFQHDGTSETELGVPELHGRPRGDVPVTLSHFLAGTASLSVAMVTFAGEFRC